MIASPYDGSLSELISASSSSQSVFGVARG